MKLVTYHHANQHQAGFLVADRVMSIALAAQQAGMTLADKSILELLEAGEPARQMLQSLWSRQQEFMAHTVPLSAVTLLAPIPVPRRNIFCVGRNYLDHVKESHALGKQAPPPEVPQFFTKATHTVNAPQGDILLFENVSRRYDYEVELVVVIGTAGRDIKKEQAMNHVFGYSVGNDVTARDLQKRHEQWFKGKSLDSSFPFGPAIISKDDIAEVSALELSLTVNGELRQQASVAQMIFDIPTIIESLSAGLTLQPGDIIATGTPAGVGFAMNPPQYLKAGDEVVAHISQLGELRNRVVSAA